MLRFTAFLALLAVTSFSSTASAQIVWTFNGSGTIDEIRRAATDGSNVTTIANPTGPGSNPSPFPIAVDPILPDLRSPGGPDKTARLQPPSGAGDAAQTLRQIRVAAAIEALRLPDEPVDEATGVVFGQQDVHLVVPASLGRYLALPVRGRLAWVSYRARPPVTAGAASSAA